MGNTEVAVDASPAAIGKLLMLLLRGLALHFGIHCLDVMTVATLPRVGFLHAQPYTLGHFHAVLFDLFLGINPAGEMPDGRAFKDANEFKQRLLEDRDELARAFIEHLCTYSLRRVLSFDDQDDLNAIATEAKKTDYRVKDIVRAVAMSELMRKR